MAPHMDPVAATGSRLYHDAIMAAARELGHSFTTSDFLMLVGHPWPVNRTALQEHISSSGDVEAFRSAWHRHYQGMRASLALKAGVMELLDRLGELGLPRAVCTASSREDVEHRFELHGLTHRSTP